jgi:hypothetical protein
MFFEFRIQDHGLRPVPLLLVSPKTDDFGRKAG